MQIVLLFKIKILIHATTTYLLALLFLLNVANAKEANEKTKIDFLSMQTGHAIQTLKRVYHDEQKTFDHLLSDIAENVSKSHPIIQALANEKSIENRTLYAELLVRCARGLKVPSWERDDHTLDELGLDELGNRASALFDFPDPFVRTLAE